MLTMVGPESAALAVAAALHHFADGATMSISSIAGLWHVLTTVVVPAILIAMSCLITFFSLPSPRRVSGVDRGQPVVLELSKIDRSGGSGSGPERRSGEHGAECAVTRFYRVTFVDERSFRLWTERVVEFSAVVRDLVADRRLELRPVIFVPLRPAPGAALQAYVSAGARTLTAHLSGAATVDADPIRAEALPSGLTMLFGDGVDADEYEKRHT